MSPMLIGVFHIISVLSDVFDRISMYLGEPIATGDNLLLYWTIGEEETE